MKGKYTMVVMAIFASLMAVSFSGISTPASYSFSYDDPAGDVTNANVDLTHVQASLEGSDVVFELTVSGNIVDSSEYSYMITVTSTTDTSNYSAPSAVITYMNGSAMYMGNGGYFSINATKSAGTLTIPVPSSSFQNFTGFYLSMASAVCTTDYTTDLIMPGLTGSGGSEGSGGTGSEENHGTDPTTETPTDTSISVDITEVKIDIKKVDNGQNWQMKETVKGTTSGVDHVSLNFVAYFKNGTHVWSGWMKGPISPPSMNPPGMTVNEMSFNSTSGNWNTWELNIDIKVPVSTASDPMTAHTVDISKVRIYARAFADANETQWNQDYYEFTPSTSETSVSYDSTSSGGSGSSGGGIPGFEAVVAIAALSIAGLAYTYRRKH